MKTVVITGSTSGLGLEMAKNFRKAGMNVVLNGSTLPRLSSAKKAISELDGTGTVYAYRGDISSCYDIQALIDFVVHECGQIDIWINNAGVNQPSKPIWELTEEEIDALLDIDLRGTIMASRLVMQQMVKQGCGTIYNMEGYGSNDAMMLGLNLYGTTKRAVTHFTQALAREAEEMKTGVIVGRLSPGIMITDFTVKALGGKQDIALSDKTKKVYNILGDKPDVVAAFLVDAMLKNVKNNVHFEWLTSRKAAWRFMTAGFNKRNFFD